MASLQEDRNFLLNVIDDFKKADINPPNNVISRREFFSYYNPRASEFTRKDQERVKSAAAHVFADGGVLKDQHVFRPPKLAPDKSDENAYGRMAEDLAESVIRSGKPLANKAIKEATPYVESAAGKVKRLWQDFTEKKQSSPPKPESLDNVPPQPEVRTDLSDLNRQDVANLDADHNGYVTREEFMLYPTVKNMIQEGRDRVMPVAFQQIFGERRKIKTEELQQIMRDFDWFKIERDTRRLKLPKPKDGRLLYSQEMHEQIGEIMNSAITEISPLALSNIGQQKEKGKASCQVC